MKGYRGIIEHLIQDDGDGQMVVDAMLFGGRAGRVPQRPRRDGSFDYYVNEPVVNNDLKGIGPFILAGIEMQQLTGPAATNSPDANSNIC